jgi:SAM-dependent methyltransferase
MSTIDADNLEEVFQCAFRNDDPQEALQLKLLADMQDEHTTDVLARAGIAAGWRCLDIGPGAGTVTAWMANQVRPGGHVTALDLDPCHVQSGEDVTIRCDDVRTARLPDEYFDLIHVRLVLMHLPERETVLDRLVDALKPGGLLVVSDWDATRRDWLLYAPAERVAAVFDAFQEGLLGVLEERGADLGWARRAPLTMRAAGLVELETVVHSRLWAGGESGCMLHMSIAGQLRTELLARGLTSQQLDLLDEAMLHPATLAYGYWMFTTIGRRPDQ